MYTSEHDGFLRLKDGKFEMQRTLSRGQWGVTMDDAGRIYRNTNSAALYVDLVPAISLLRNPNLLRTRGSYESIADQQANAVYPLRPTRGVNRGYQDGVLRADGTLAAYTAAAAPTVYRGDRLPNDLYGNVFIAEPSGNLVGRLVIKDTGTGLKAERAYERGEFIASTDERFRPVNLFSTPDGTMYVVDMYRGIIQHRGYITEYLRDHIIANKLELPTGLGRIYRVVHTSTKRAARPVLSKDTPAQLVQRLSHPNGWYRDTAQRLLVERGAPGVLPQLKQLAETGKDGRARLHALWTLDGVDRIEASTVTAALGDSSRDIRLSAVRLAERWLRMPAHPMHAAVIARIDDTDWSVRRQLAASLGELPVGAREPAIARMLEKHGDDPIVVDAAISGLARPRTCGDQDLAGLVHRNAAARRGTDDAGGDGRAWRRRRVRAGRVRSDRARRDAGVAAIGAAARRRGSADQPGDADRARRGARRGRRWRRSRGRRSDGARSARRTGRCLGVPGTRAGRTGRRRTGRGPRGGRAGCCGRGAWRVVAAARPAHR